MKTNWRAWRSGLKNGIPVGLGYFAVSFTFGIIAKQAGLNPFEAGLCLRQTSRQLANLRDLR